MTDGRITRDQLLHNRNLPPVCRVHVYQASIYLNKTDYKQANQLPRSWAGDPATYLPGAGNNFQTPDAVMGQDPVVILRNGGKLTGQVVPIDWAVLDARVNRTRQWNCSTAIVHVASKVEVGQPIRRPPVRPNDVIVIEMGYTASYLSKVSFASGRTDYSKFKGDSVFYGVVDTVKVRDGQGATDGIVWTIQARCTMRFLSDNKMRANYNPNGLDKLGTNRATVIRDLLYLGSLIDYVEWEQLPGTAPGAPGGSKDVGGTIKRRKQNELEGLKEVTDVIAMRQPKRDASKKGNPIIAATGDPWTNSYLTLGMIEMSTRADVLSPQIADTQQGVRIMDKFPLDVIKHFSLVESAPRELWADERTGHIHWMARRTDMTRLKDDALKHTRQYFYRYPSDRANILSGTHEWSTIGTVTHFILTNPLVQSQGATDHVDLYAESPIAYSRDPHTGYPLRMATRNRFLYDDTLTTSDNPRAVVGAMLEIYGRALMTGMVMVPGDPTLTVGEAVQLHNTGLFGRLTFGGADTVETGKSVVIDNQDYGLQQDGIFRVEALQQLFAVGGPSRGYTTVFVYGPADPDVGVLYTDAQNQKADALYHAKHPLGQRVITSAAEWTKLRNEFCLSTAQLLSKDPVISNWQAADIKATQDAAEQLKGNTKGNQQ